MAFHPSAPSLFLAGFADGRVALFVSSHALPLVSWGAPWRAPAAAEARQRSVVPVVRVAWVPGRQSAFVAVDADGWLGAWDLLTSTATALSCTRVVADAAAAATVMSVDVCGATTLAKTSVVALVATASGVVEASLTADLIAPRPGEMRALRALISRRHL